MAKGLRFKDAEKARDEITSEQLKRISKLYNDWADDIAKKAEKLKRKGTMSSELQERQMKELEQALRKTSEKVANDVTKTVKDGMAKICQSVIAENSDWMESLGFPKDIISAAFSSVPDNVVRNIVTGKIYESGWSLSKSIWGDNEDTLAKIHEIVAGGMAENKPIYDIAKDLEQYVRPDARKQWNLKTKSGKMIYPKKVDYNAQRLARTLSQHAYQQTIKTTSTENPFIQKVKWHSSGNRVCEICKKRNGKIFPIDKLPMDHPNGFCIMEQLVDDNIDDRLIDWVNGKEDKELDGFAKKLGFSVDDMNVKESKVSQHDIIQEQILEKYGYSKDNMPESYVKLFMQLEKNPEDYELFFKMAKEKGLSGSKFYDKYVAKHKWGNAPKATAKKVAKTAVEKVEPKPASDLETLVAETMKGSKFDKDKWIDMLNSNDEDKMNEWTKDWIFKVASKDKTAVRRYTGSMYEHMNKLLRDPEKEKSLQPAQFISKVEDLIGKCQNALSKASLPEDVVVRRGNDYNVLTSFGLDDGSITKDKINSIIGSIVEEKSFLSASSSRGGKFDDCKYEYVIKLPKGSQAVYVDSFSYHQGEKEVLVNAGGKYMIEDVDFDANGNVTKIYMTLMNLQN